ncbi:hypothetical protein THAOC_27280, partial [Thalassiosira oceanica]
GGRDVTRLVERVVRAGESDGADAVAVVAVGALVVAVVVAVASMSVSALVAVPTGPVGVGRGLRGLVRVRPRPSPYVAEYGRREGALGRRVESGPRRRRRACLAAAVLVAPPWSRRRGPLVSVVRVTARLAPMAAVLGRRARAPVVVRRSDPSRGGSRATRRTSSGR